jgi:dihydrofolate reductase
VNIKCSVYIAASVDGFIARPDGDIDWLHKPEYASTEQGSFGYDAFIATVDALVMGRHSFEKVLTFASWPYENTPVVVLSSRELAIPDRLHGKVKVESGAPQALVSRLASEGKQHLYIDGGVTIQRFLQARLINEITITQIPLLLGGGIPLFGSIGIEVPLSHLETTSFGNGFIQSRYQVTYAA